jgi:D-alanyl-D-alanine carboxypeptidase
MNSESAINRAALGTFPLAVAAALLAIPAWQAAAQTPPLLAVSRAQTGPRLTWTNVAGQTYQLLARERLGEGDWLPLVTLTTDGTAANWTDEAPLRPSLFYAVTARADTNWARKLQIALDNARKTYAVKGLSAVVITTNGIWQGTSGFSEPALSNSIQPYMRFSIGSVTKTFTAALIMQLAEEGKLFLTDPISNWLPNYPNITNTITIRQLLNHTSGVYDFTENPAYWPMVSQTNKVYTPQEVLALVKAPYFPPGGGWHYSSTGYILLGLIAEAISQESVASQIRSRFLEPLQLRSTYLEGSELASGERAHGFSINYTGTLDDIFNHPLWPVEYPVAWTAGAMTSTAYDVARWTRALYGGEVLTPASLSAMTTWVAGSSPTYGLGTMRLTSSKGDFWGHVGGITGYTSWAGHSPTRNLTVIVLINQDNDYFSAIWRALVDAL